MRSNKQRNGAAARAPGRPPLLGERMRPVNLRLDDETVRTARWLGEGSVSAGVRLAMRILREMRR